MAGTTAAAALASAAAAPAASTAAGASAAAAPAASAAAAPGRGGQEEDEGAAALQEFCRGVRWADHLGQDDPTPVYMFDKYPIDRSIVFFWSSLSFAFTNLKPFLPGHVLVSPKKIVRRFCELEKDEVCDLFETARKVAALVLLSHRRNAYSLALQDGSAAGQTVAHVHLHIMPQFPKDCAEGSVLLPQQPPHTSTGHGSGTCIDAGERRPRQQSEMAKEAAELRKLVHELAEKYPSYAAPAAQRA